MPAIAAVLIKWVDLIFLFFVESKYMIGLDLNQSPNHLEMLGGAALVRIISQLSSEQIKEAGVWRICNKIKLRIADSADQRGMTVIGVRPIMASRCRSFFVSQAERLVD
jgi:hypothetical protein